MNLNKIFEKLQLEPHNTLLFLHVSLDALAPLMSVKELFSALDTYFDDRSTICMPSFPFSGAGYFDYLIENPLFDVVNTPCRVNLACEIFRRKAEVARSLHLWCPVACKGYLAKDLVSEHHLVVHAFGQQSPFGKIRAAGGYVVGLGVDCNTNSFAHLPDDQMLAYYSFPVYEPKLFTGKCIDSEGKIITVKTNLVERTVSRRIKPRKMRLHLQTQDFYHETEIEGVNFYAMQIAKYVDFTVRYNIDIAKKEGKPVYYE